jgi:hypothetical protein
MNAAEFAFAAVHRLQSCLLSELQVKGILTADLNTLPTILMDHRAHLTENEFDRIVKLQVSLSRRFN